MAKQRSENPLDHGRYVVLRHEGIEEPHFDLMFERAEIDDKLVTFRSAVWPITTRTTLVKIQDHRNTYLQYEGPISGNRGFARRVEEGLYESSKLGEHRFMILLPQASLAIKQVSETEWVVDPVGA